MEISNDIMKIVAKKEKDKHNYQRCLANLVCPKCGKLLLPDYDEILEAPMYECTALHCDFFHRPHSKDE